MRNIIAICKRELLSFFVSPIAYFVIAGFALLIGYFFIISLEALARMYQMSQMITMRGGELPNLNQVIEGLYQTMIVILVFLVPMLTMRTIAEEKRRGTFELLITSPVSIMQIVVGKFLSLAVIIFAMLAVVSLFPLLLINYGNPEIPPILSGLVGVLLCTLSFASIGMAASSFTDNQIVAGISSMVTLLLLYVIAAPAESFSGLTAEVIRSLSPIEQVQDLLRGVLSLKSFAYFGSLIFLGLFISQRALEAHRWR